MILVKTVAEGKVIQTCSRRTGWWLPFSADHGAVTTFAQTSTMALYECNYPSMLRHRILPTTLLSNAEHLQGHYQYKIDLATHKREINLLSQSKAAPSSDGRADML